MKVTYLFESILEDYKIFGLCADDNVTVNTKFLKIFSLWINRCCTYTTCDKYDLLFLEFFYRLFAKIGWLAQGANNIRKIVTLFKVLKSESLSSDSLYNYFNCSLFSVIVTNCKRNSLPLCIYADNKKLSG